MINLIAAMGRDGQIGLANDLPWRGDPNLETITEVDMLWFKRLTDEGVLVVGTTTAQAMADAGFKQGNRVVETWSRKLDMTPGRFLSNTMGRYRGREIWICGGAMTYEVFMPFVQRHYIARIPYSGPADAYMPPICETWQKMETPNE